MRLVHHNFFYHSSKRSWSHTRSRFLRASQRETELLKQLVKVTEEYNKQAEENKKQAEENRKLMRELPEARNHM